MKPSWSQICPPAHLLGCFWVQVGVQQGNGELDLSGAPGFHDGSVCQKGWRDKKEEKENGVIQGKTIQKEGKKLRDWDWEE